MSRLALDLVQFRDRVLQDALTEATAAYWGRRAEAFQDARPRPGDFTGKATDADLAAADRRCADVARACRAKATVTTAGRPEPIAADVYNAVREVAA